MADPMKDPTANSLQFAHLTRRSSKTRKVMDATAFCVVSRPAVAPQRIQHLLLGAPKRVILGEDERHHRFAEREPEMIADTKKTAEQRCPKRLEALE